MNTQVINQASPKSNNIINAYYKPNFFITYYAKLAASGHLLEYPPEQKINHNKALSSLSNQE